MTRMETVLSAALCDPEYAVKAAPALLRALDLVKPEPEPEPDDESDFGFSVRKGFTESLAAFEARVITGRS